MFKIDHNYIHDYIKVQIDLCSSCGPGGVHHNLDEKDRIAIEDGIRKAASWLTNPES